MVVEGDTYSPVGGIAGSAQRREGALATHDVEFVGLITSDKITDADLIAKRYDDAEVTLKVVDWQYPWAGVIASAKWWIDSTQYDGETWKAVIGGWSRWLQAKIGDKFIRPCRVKLGSAKCGVNLTGFTITGVTVLGMLDGEKKRIIRATTGSLSGSFTDGWFAWGEITGTSGANNGITRDVKAYTQATRDIECQLPFPFEIAAGDTFTVVAGCNGLKATCKTKFSNLVNHQGFEFMPSTDEVLKVRPA